MLKAIKVYGERQLKAIRSNSDNIGILLHIHFKERLNLDEREAFDEIKKQEKKIYYMKLACIHSNKTVYNFNLFRIPRDLFRSIYFGDILQNMQRIDKMKWKKL